MMGDLRAATRSLIRSPGFSVVAIATLAVAVGANSAIFSVVDGVLLKPLAYAAPDQLVRVMNPAPAEGRTPTPGSFSPQDLEDLERESTAYASVASYISGLVQVLGGVEPREASIAHVSGDFFTTLGVNPVEGRALRVDDDVVGGDQAVVVSHEFWESQLGSDPDAVGRSLTLPDGEHPIVGVMPASFDFPSAETELWAPISRIRDEDIPHIRDHRWMSVIARLAPGVSAEAAETESSAILRQLAAEYPDSNEGWGVAEVTSLRDSIVREVRPSLLALLGTVGLVLLIACANLANLVIARGLLRKRETAARVALGASRRHLLGQLLWEGVVLGVVGGVIGFLLAVQALPLLMAMGGGTIPLQDQISPDLRVAGMTLVLGVAIAVVFSMAAALNAIRTDPQTVLRDGGRGSTGGRGSARSRAALVVVQTALAVVLLAGAGLMVRTLQALSDVDTGMNAENVLVLGLSMQMEDQTRDLHQEERRQIVRRVEELPGVVAVGGSKTMPLDGGGEPYEFTIPGISNASSVRPEAGTYIVTPGYFESLGIPLEGETFGPAEDALELVINRTMAELYWPNGGAIGSTLTLGDAEFRITGIAGDVRTAGIREVPVPATYVSSDLFIRSSFQLFVRTTGDPMRTLEGVRAVIREVNPQQPISNVTTLSEMVRLESAESRFLAMLLGIFGGIALFLAAIGVYGVTAFAVGERTTEIGVRMALGAARSDVLRMVVGRTMGMALAGLAIGVPIALGATRVLQSTLYGVGAQDPLALGIAALSLTAVMFLAGQIPAQRATRVSPTVALRS